MIRVILCLIFSVTLITYLPAQNPGSGKNIEQVLKDWKAQQERLQSVRYRLVGTEESLGGPLMADAPAPIHGPRAVKVVVLIDLVNKRYRLDEDLGIPSKARDRFVRRATTTTFDGKVAYRSVPRENEERNPELPDMSITKGDLSQSRVDTYLEPAFIAHGLIPTEDSPLGPGRFPSDHELDDFILPGIVAHGGRTVLSLRTGPSATTPSLSDEFWVDSQRQSAVARQIHWQGKNPFYRTDTDFQQTPHGWLPQKWVSVNSLGTEVRNITRINVEGIEANPALQDDFFSLPMKSGMIIKVYEYASRGKGIDPSLPANTTLQVDSEGNLTEVKKEGYRTIEGVQLPPESGNKRWWWIGCIAFIAVTISISFLIWKRRRRP